MELRDHNVLFFTRTMKMGGTENIVLYLCEILNPQVNKIVVCSCGGIHTEELGQMGITHYIIPDIERKTPGVMLKTMKILRHIVDKEQITVIHTHHRMAAFYIRVLGLDKMCIFISTVHNTFHDKRKLTTFSYKNSHLVACGEIVKKNLTETFGVPKQQVTVIPNAVKAFDKPIIEISDIKRLREKGNFLVANVGRLCLQKGMEYYIRAIPEVIVKHPNTHFFIVGAGEEEQNLRRSIDNLKVKKYVTFLGYRADIQNVISQMDVVILSSLWEGLPLIPIETFSVGKTIIATAVDGTVEIVEDQKSGLLVPSYNSEKIAEKINWLIDNPEKKRKMELNARERYDKAFSFAQFSDAYSKYYKEVCE